MIHLVRGSVRDNQGLTLLEVIIAMALTTMALLMLSGFTTIIVNGLAQGQLITKATLLAQEKLEELQARSTHIPLGMRTLKESVGSIPQFPEFQRTVEIATHTPVEGLQTVTVTVSWHKGAHSVTLTTLFPED
ncbi:MAG: hypothetical protein D6704_12710 [Nitrospirae bacterium]|nr:MAG: hypothetical protein D6704_12710 [Nitrospirota bacterium]